MHRNATVHWVNRDHTGWWIYEEVEHWITKRQKRLSPTSRCLVRRNLRLIRAASREQAYRKAMSCSRADRPSETHGGQWRFAGIAMLLPIYEKIADGAEILWEEDRVMSLTKMRKLIKSKRQLPVFDDQKHNKADAGSPRSRSGS